MISSEVAYNIIGFIGAVLILMGFYRTSVGKWRNKSFVYELDNLVGALLLVIYQFRYDAFISVSVNVIWAIVAFRGLLPFAERYNRKLRRELRHKTLVSRTKKKRRQKKKT